MPDPKVPKGGCQRRRRGVQIWCAECQGYMNFFSCRMTKNHHGGSNGHPEKGELGSIGMAVQKPGCDYPEHEHSGMEVYIEFQGRKGAHWDPHHSSLIKYGPCRGFLHVHPPFYRHAMDSRSRGGYTAIYMWFGTPNNKYRWTKVPGEHGPVAVEKDSDDLES